jgi:hypothetical protein
LEFANFETFCIMSKNFVKFDYISGSIKLTRKV